MKHIKYLTICLSLFFLNTFSYGQEQTTNSVHLIKFSPFHLAHHTFQAGYEFQSLSKNLGIDLNFGYMSYNRSYSHESESINGANIELQVRRYLADKMELRSDRKININPFYTPYLSLHYYNSMSDYTYSVAEDSFPYNSIEETVTSHLESYSIGGGLLVGVQLKLFNSLYTDIFFGSGVKSALIKNKPVDENYHYTGSIHFNPTLNGIIGRAGFRLGIIF